MSVMMSVFLGREKEMSRLQEIYEQPGLQTCAVYGRRSVGKSRLLAEFTKDKRTISFQFIKRSYIENLVRLRGELESFLGREVEAETFTELMWVVRDICREEKTIVILDEFPYLIRDAPHVTSALQAFLDVDVRDLNCMVVICGSSESMIRDAVERISSPLYGRFMNRMRVRPLTFRQCTGFHRNMSDIDAIRTYLTVGGIPKYHLMMSRDTYEQSLATCFFGDDPPLSNEAYALVSEESHADIYSGIMMCISDGQTDQKRICQKLGLDKGTCSKMIRELEELGYVARRRPMNGAPKRPTFYISDNVLAFWYEVISRHPTMLSSLRMDDDMKLKLIAHEVDTFMGLRFELLCREYIEESYNVGDIGKWWGNVDGTDTDIDIIANVYDSRMCMSQIFVECKFSRNPVGFSDLNRLIHRTEKTLSTPNLHYMLISRSGFDGELEEYASEHGIALVGPDKLLGRVPPDDLDGMPYGGFVRMS